MIPHQDIVVDTPSEPLDHHRQSSQKSLPIRLVSKDLPPLISPAGDVPDRPRMIQPKWPRHRRTAYHQLTYSQT